MKKNEKLNRKKNKKKDESFVRRDERRMKALLGNRRKDENYIRK